MSKALRRVVSGAVLALTTALVAPLATAATAKARGASGIRPTTERRVESIRKARVGAPESPRQTRDSRRWDIPAALRAAFAKKIERRIARNTARSHAFRREALGLLARFLEEADPRSAEMPEALLRIAELEWEDARDRFLVAFQAWERRPADRRGEPPQPSYAQSRKRLFRVLTQYKDFRDYDLALYVDGFLASEEGKLLEARSRFDKILEWFPKSRFVPDAHMARAEYEFSKAKPDYEVAFREYERVLAYRDSELYDLALFKSAWTLWRLGKPDEAARRFLTVFRAAEGSGGPKRAREDIDELQREALKNLVAVFAEDERNTAEDMHRFLVRAGGEQFAGRIVEALAEAFFEQAHYERAVEAYKLLLKLEPTSPRGYEHALRVAEAHSTMESWALLRQDYQWILKDFVRGRAAAAPPTSAWLSAQPKVVLDASESAVERRLREDAIGLHAKAQADENSRAEFEAAAALYELYLTRFAALATAYEVSFNLAEIHFHRLGRADRAADAYLTCVRMNPRAPLSRTALYNALGALEAARAAEFDEAKRANRKPTETGTDKKLTEAMELYLKTYPDDPAVPELLFRQGKLYYDYQVYDPAVRQWGLLLERYPTHQFAGTAGELILDSFNRSRDFANIETWARRLKKAPAFQGPQQQARLDGLIVGAVFKQGEQWSSSGDAAKATSAYLRAAKEFPNDPRAAQAAVNATAEARRAGDLASLSEAAGLLSAKHVKRAESAQGVWIAANTYQEVGLFREAAKYHALIARHWPRYAHHQAAAYNAVLLSTAVGDHQDAIRSGERFRQSYAREPAGDEVLFLMGKAHEKANRKRDAAELYQRYASNAKNPSSQIEAWVRLASVSGDERARTTALERAVQTYTKRRSGLDERGLYYAARARYMQGEAHLARFDAVTIGGDVKQLQERLRRKTDLLKKAADTFLATAQMGVAEWTTASLYQIGFAYESFSRALLSSPPPTSLSASEQESYRQSIEEFVIPIEERSLEAYESGWQKAVELGIFNSWTAKMRQALGRLNAELYPPLKEIGFELRARGPMPLPALIEAPRRGSDGRSLPYVMVDPRATENKKSARDRDAARVSP